ncbi:hypothetical protein GCM10023065_31090 [Microbacterium laevaniformans]
MERFGIGFEQVTEHLAQARARHGALTQDPDGTIAGADQPVASTIVEATPCVEGPPSRYTATLSRSML